jgi:CubicO group peptidase (beta-lactamase class C family)
MSIHAEISGIAPQQRLSRRRVLQFGGGALAAAAGLTSSRLGTLAQSTPTTGSTTASAAIEAFALEVLETYGVPGVAVAVVEHGEVTLQAGYGVRQFDEETPADADTIFQLASITKPMTSFTFGTLVDDGLVDWDTPVIAYLPELQLMDPYATRHATPRDFLAHRSGLPEFFGDIVGRMGYDHDELLWRMRYVTPGSTFREVAAYSNLGFFIVGEVIRRVTGMPWEDAMQERLFDPAGMDRSGPSLASLPGDDNVASNHAMIGGAMQTVELDHHGTIGAAGSAFSTARDMGLWMQMLLNDGSAQGRSLIQPETLRQIFEPSMVTELSFSEAEPINEHAGFAYGLGWGNYHFNGFEIIEKGGALGGVRAVVSLVPQLRSGVAVIANLNLTVYPEAVRAFALEQFAGPAATDPQPSILQQQQFIDSIFAQTATIENPGPPSVPLEQYAGVYENTLHGLFTLTVDGDELHVEAGPAGRPAILRHFSYDTFLLDWNSVVQLPEETVFAIGPDGIARSFEIESLGRFDRVEAD